jgi:hypothetical protein
MTVARSTKHKAKETIAALVDLVAGPGTARSLAGKAKGLAGAGASRLARAAAAAAVRLEAAGKADALAGRLEAQAARARKQTRARLKSSTRRRKSFAGYDQRRKTKDQIAIGRWSFVLGPPNQQPTSAELY